MVEFQKRKNSNIYVIEFDKHCIGVFFWRDLKHIHAVHMINLVG
jgi:hypothetical protein